MMQTLRGSVDDLEQRIQQQVADNQENAAVQTQAVKDTLEDMTSGWMRSRENCLRRYTLRMYCNIAIFRIF